MTFVADLITALLSALEAWLRVWLNTRQLMRDFDRFVQHEVPRWDIERLHRPVAQA